MSLINRRLERDLNLELKKDWTVDKIEVTDEYMIVELSGKDKDITRGNTPFKLGLKILDISNNRFPNIGTTTIEDNTFKVKFKPKKDGA